MTANDVEAICTLTVELTRLRQDECKHLAVENVGPEIFGRLLREFLRAEKETPT